MNVLFMVLRRLLIVYKASYEYGKRNLYDGEKQNQIYNKLLENILK